MFGVTTFSIMILSTKGLFVTLSIMALDVECCYAESREILIIMLSVVMLNKVPKYY
jgi:hypothetical protein